MRYRKRENVVAHAKKLWLRGPSTNDQPSITTVGEVERGSQYCYSGTWLNRPILLQLALLAIEVRV